MKAVELLSDEMTVASQQSGYELTIVGVYQDLLTQSWEVPTCRMAKQLAGEDLVRDTWYEVYSLSDLDILLAAVHAALVADVIVVSVYAADELPLNLYVWINSWLPPRNPREGAFTALIGADKPQDSQSVRTHVYLHAVACKAQLDFIPLLKPVVMRKSEQQGRMATGGGDLC
jgi:hypothetical protein